MHTPTYIYIYIYMYVIYIYICIYIYTSIFIYWLLAASPNHHTVKWIRKNTVTIAKWIKSSGPEQCGFVARVRCRMACILDKTWALATLVDTFVLIFGSWGWLWSYRGVCFRVRGQKVRNNSKNDAQMEARGHPLECFRHLFLLTLSARTPLGHRFDVLLLTF